MRCVKYHINIHTGSFNEGPTHKNGACVSDSEKSVAIITTSNQH